MTLLINPSVKETDSHTRLQLIRSVKTITIDLNIIIITREIETILLDRALTIEIITATETIAPIKIT